VQKGETLLFPLPRHIVHLDNRTFAKMPIGDAVQCDLGNVRLPELPVAGEQRYQIFEETAWVEYADLADVLRGGVPKKVYTYTDFFAKEPRVGIARDNRTRIVKEGMLYMTQHIRLAEEVSVVLAVSGFEDLVDKGVCRLGGEGRGATYESVQVDPISPPDKPTGVVEGIFFSLLTPGRLDPLRPMGSRTTSACVGKSLTIGGFDMNRFGSRSAQGYVPPGSTWFVEMPESEAEAFIEQHHETQIGEERELGYGRIVCGYWTK
jgi:CRISPR-associated protein Cmr3